ncbi:flagellin lysine-N-methylase [Tunturibacter empetritectus]|uniref:Lysine-N-methylase n=1 Tax=Tunturiibacter empetritectus TaxID=3069691 RepID=A0A7W8IH84_9BACT|nr:flagellin lysine-N-methylase [Edaphobacter lichenicola]MBB5317147.1 lysine-N-methylase [Edaphobacter lichenicola]
MRPETQKIQPQYGSAFHCIGTECEDSCCHGMSVLVDRKTYEGYQAFPEETLGALVKQYVSILPVGATDALYARITPNASGRCPFLSAEQLCGVQKEYGSALLSATCSTYPRALNSVENELEVSLYLSCPQAARQVLLDADSTRAVGEASSDRFRTDQSSRLATGAGAIHKPIRYFWEVRDLVVAMIHDRRRPMWQRLFLLGMLSKRLNEVTTARDDEAVPEVLASYWEIVENGALCDKLEMVPAQPAVQLDVVLRLIDQRIRAGSCGQRFLECFDEFLQGIGYSAGSTAASDAFNYVEAESRYCAPFFAEHPHILENYLLNYVYRTLFPFGREASAHITPQGIFGEFLLMVTQYALVYGLLAGMAGHAREAFGEEHVVRLVQSFSRTVEHSPRYLKEINALIESRGLGDPQGIATLLKFS